jgi:glucose/arabinose dehydrogenase
VTHLPRTSVALLLAASLLLAACGSDGDDGSSSPSVTQVGSGEPTTDTEPSEDGSDATSPAPADPDATAPEVTSVIAATASEPIVLLPRPGDDTHLWLAERSGRVRRLEVVDGGELLRSNDDEVLDLSDRTSVDAERGLLGMAFSEDGTILFVSYTNLDGNTRVESYELDGDEVDESTRRERFAIDQPFANHNGGNIVLGPDGRLWLGLGDGGAADDPENRAQDPSTELGKIIAIDLATDETEIMVSGVRNPWRFSFDTDGALWIGDVGQNQYEEIDHLSAGEIAGANLGWSGFEGVHRYLEDPERTPAEPVPPVFEYPHDGGNCSITGGFAYRGTAIPALEGAYLFADYCLGRVRAITLDANGDLASEFDLGVDVPGPISFGTDQAGEAYVLSADGNIVRLLAV